MAITNAQQYQQLVNKPANGKRPGYRGIGGYQEGKSADAKGTGTGASVNDAVDTGDFGSERENVQQNISANLGGSGRADPVETVEKLQRFYNERPEVKTYGLSSFFKNPIQKFSNFTTAKNRPFFGKVVGAGKLNLNGKNIDLETIGLMDDDELEQTYQDYMSERLAGNIDAYGNPLNQGGDGPDQPIIPLMAQAPVTEETELDPNSLQGMLADRVAYRFMADGGMTDDAPVEGGIMDLESGRQMYFLGKLVKKATRAVKKIAKSPIGKAALLYGAGTLGASFLGKTQAAGGIGKFLFGQGMKPGFSGPGIPGLFNKLGLTKTAGSLMPTIKGGIALASLTPLLFGQQEEEQPDYASNRGPGLNIAQIRQDPYNTMGQSYRFYAEGGDVEPVAKKTMPLLDMDGKEMDLRADGGFVPIGRMERADDVPARLSKNEFVFTADAVRNAGDGDIDKGAEVMYNMMKNLESGGEVSEESQGLDGAREMFQTSQRLEEVL